MSVRLANLDNLEPNAQRRSSAFDCVQVGSAWAGVPQNDNAGQPGDHGLQQFDPLAREFRRVEKNPGEVPTGPRVTLDVAFCNRVGRQIPRDDRDGAGRRVGGTDRRCVGRPDHIDLQPNELSGGVGKLRRVAGGFAEFKRNVFAVDPTRVGERPTKWLPPLFCVVAGKVHVTSENPNAPDIRLSPALSRPSEAGQQCNRNEQYGSSSMSRALAYVVPTGSNHHSICLAQSTLRLLYRITSSARSNIRCAMVRQRSSDCSSR